MNVRKLLILSLLVQRLIVSRQAIIPTRSWCTHKPRLQRVWRRGPFRFDIAQYEPTRWEWDERMLRDSGRDTLGTRLEPVHVRKHHLPNENRPKLLWKSEHRHEDYDSLMESDDAVAVWPEPFVGDRSMMAGKHDNVGSRLVKTPRNTDSGVHSGKSCEERSAKVVKHSCCVEETVRSSENSPGANICELCGGLITSTTEMPSVLTTTLNPSIIESLDTVILLPPFQEAQSSNQILSIQPHPNTNDTMAIFDVEINREARGKNNESDVAYISSKLASDTDHMMLSSSNAPSVEKINSTPPKALDHSVDEVTTGIPPQPTTPIYNERFNGSPGIEVGNSTVPTKTSEIDGQVSSPVDVPANLSDVSNVRTSTLSTVSTIIPPRIRQRHANSFSTPMPLQTSSQNVHDSMSVDDLMSTERCPTTVTTRQWQTSQPLNVTLSTIKTTTSTYTTTSTIRVPEGPSHANSFLCGTTQEVYEPSTESTTFEGHSVTSVTVPVVGSSTIRYTELRKPVNPGTICRIETENAVTEPAGSSTTGVDFFLPEMLPPLTPPVLSPDDDFAETGGILSKMLKAILSLIESIFELFSDSGSSCDENTPTLVDFGFDFSEEKIA